MSETQQQYTEPFNPGEGGAPAGPAPEQDFTTGFDDYWGTDETKRIMLPDGKQWFDIKLMTEGERAQYERTQNQDLRVDREGSTTIKVDPGRARKALLKAAVCGWNLVKNGKPVTFSDAELNRFVDQANPRIVDKLEREIRDFNEWLKNDLTVEEIEREIATLEKELENAKRREAGE